MAEKTAWENQALLAGLEEIHILYAEEVAVSPGAQLFALAATLFRMGLYTDIGVPNGNAQQWKDSITS